MYASIGAGLLLALSAANGLGYGFSDLVRRGPQPSMPLVHASPHESTVTVTATPTWPPQVDPTSPSAAPTAAPVPLQAGAASSSPDLPEVLLVFHPEHRTLADENIVLLAEYYGLGCAELSIKNSTLTSQVLKDQAGEYYRLIAISADTLARAKTELSEQELAALEEAIQEGGSHLLVSKVNTNQDTSLLSRLTDGIITGAFEPTDSEADWIISPDAPEITREFTDLAFSDADQQGPQDDLGLQCDVATSTSLISSTNDQGSRYPIFVQYKKGQGSILVDSGAQPERLRHTELRHAYYAVSSITRIIPMMMALRYAAGEEAWHTPRDYANLTIDDPPLVSTFEHLDYDSLLREMQEHDFCTTIAMHPAQWRLTQQPVIALFRRNPHRFSIVQHGNNGDDYEFYRYQVGEGDPFRARPLAEQEANLLQGAQRLDDHYKRTGIAWDRIMIFPYGVPPEETFTLLKRHNYLGTVNRESIPLDAPNPNAWDFQMQPAALDSGGFPALLRRHLGSASLDLDFEFAIWDLFIDKPALFYTHPYDNELFDTGNDAFSPIADHLNRLHGQVEWRSLGHIATHLYREKRADDGSIDCRFYTNHVIITNDSSQSVTYHASKTEVIDVPIKRLTVNQHPFPYRIEDGFLKLDLHIPGGQSADIQIEYGE